MRTESKGSKHMPVWPKNQQFRINASTSSAVKFTSNEPLGLGASFDSRKVPIGTRSGHELSTW